MREIAEIVGACIVMLGMLAVIALSLWPIWLSLAAIIYIWRAL